MKKYFQISFLILAYALNFAHELQPHEHSEYTFTSDLSSNIAKHHEHSQSEHHNDSDANEHANGQDDHNLPFSHCHSLHSHTNVQIINTQPTIDIVNDNSIYYSKYDYQPPKFIKNDIFQSDEINYFLATIGSSISLRAPPPFS